MKQRRFVVDSNFLQNPALREFLSASPNNQVVLTDYAWMEAYKGDTLRSIFKSVEILAKFPKQVVVLKGTMVVGTLRGRRSGLVRRMIWEEGTREFPEFCQKLEKAEQGDKRLAVQLLEHGRSADQQMARVLRDAARLIPIFENVARIFTSEEISNLRAGRPLQRETAEKMLQCAEATALHLIRGHPHGIQLPRGDEILNVYIFRFTLCAVLMIKRWIQTGSQKQVRFDKIQNDMIDLSFAAYATYFDGLLSSDRKLSSLYEEARFVLRLVGAEVK